jgi:hypothetical protein
MAPPRSGAMEKFDGTNIRSFAFCIYAYACHAIPRLKGTHAVQGSRYARSLGWARHLSASVAGAPLIEGDDVTRLDKQAIAAALARGEHAAGDRDKNKN